MAKFCTNCGNELGDNADFCTGCGVSCKSITEVQSTTTTMQSSTTQSGIICRKCGSNNTAVQMLAMQKKRGIFMSIIWIILAVFTLGIILLIPLLTKKGSKAKKFVVCNNCGNSWKI